MQGSSHPGGLLMVGWEASSDRSHGAKARVLMAGDVAIALPVLHFAFRECSKTEEQ